MQQEAAWHRYRQAWRSDDRRRFAFALMVIAGWCDAAGFSMFAQLYVSFMSGDATQFGLRIAGGDWAAAARFFGAQVLFVIGAAFGRYQRTRYPENGRTIALGFNVALLAATATVGGAVLGVPAYAFAVLAMGLQNAMMTQEAGVPVGTMVTGTLVRLGENVSDRLRGAPAPLRDNAGQWLFFVLGALGGAVSYRLLGARSFWVPSAASALLIPLARRIAGRESGPGPPDDPHAEPEAAFQEGQ